MCENKGKKAIAVIFAGGTGARMEGASLPKQFLEVGGKPIIAHTIEVFERHPGIDSVVVVCVEPWIAHLEEIVLRYGFAKVSAIVPGGSTGQESIYNGLVAAEKLDGVSDDAVVLVHDGVRPLITEQTITDCLRSVCENGCTAVVAPAVETVVIRKGDCVSSIVDRQTCALARAPQGFALRDILAAHRKARSEAGCVFIDSISLMAHFGYDIYTVEGPVENIKITTREDFFAFKGFMDMREMEQLWAK